MAVGSDSMTSWALAALAVGVVAAVDPGGWFPFGPAKWLVVSVLGCVALAAWFTEGSIAKVSRFERWALGLFALLLVVAGLGALDGRYAWLGTPERHFGVLTWLGCIGLYLAGRQLASEDAERRVVRAMAVGGLVIAVWTAAEVLGHPPVSIASDTSRLTGPFGSAAYLGAAAVLFGGASLGVALSKGEGRSWRTCGWVSAAGCVVALVGSGARAAWLAAVIVAALVAVRRAPAMAKHLAPIGVAAVVGMLMIAGSTGVLERSHGAASRLDEWGVALRVIAEHPLTGVGPEGYRLAFAEGVDDHYEQQYGRAVLPDRAHSSVLDIAVTLGLPAALVWVALIVGLGRVLLSRLRTASGLGVGLAAGVLAYGAQQLLLFPLAELDPLVWALAGMCVARAVGATQATLTSPRVAVRRTALAGAVAVAVLAGVLGVREVAADRLAQRSRAAADESFADRAAGLRPDVVRYQLLAARSAEATNTVKGIDRAIDYVEAAKDLSPLDPIVLTEQARLASVRAVATGDSGDVAVALARWRALVAMDAHRSDWQLGLGYAELAAGDAETAAVAFERAAVLSPGDERITAVLDEITAAGG